MSCTYIHVHVHVALRHPHYSNKFQFGLSVPPQRHQPLACLAPIAPPHLIVCPHSKKMTDEWAAATLGVSFKIVNCSNSGGSLASPCSVDLTYPRPIYRLVQCRRTLPSALFGIWFRSGRWKWVEVVGVFSVVLHIVGPYQKKPLPTYLVFHSTHYSTIHYHYHYHYFRWW